MRFRPVLSLLLIAGLGLGAALHFAPEDGEAPPVVAKARAAWGQASDVTLERAADYWLAAADNRKKGNDIRGSGTALAIAIRLGRAEALRSGAKPVSDRLQRQFGRHYPDPVLRGARWLVAEPGSRLGRVLARWPVQEGAVTLGNVIVFKTAGASKNRSLLAHELAHVEQYHELGIGEFARRYAADPKPIEEEARTKSRRVMRTL
jgi:hypothetical protein